MKTRPLDFLLSGIALASILGAALGIIAVAVAPISGKILGDYHVIADALAFLLSFGLVAALWMRVLLAIWPLQPGDHAMDQPIFVVWKLSTVIYAFGRGALLPFTTVFAQPLVARLFGASIEGEAALGGRIADPSLVRIGAGAILGHNSAVTPHAITSGRIILEQVDIGRGATLGVNVVVMAGAKIGDGSVVAAGSVVPPFTTIPPGELWGGIPARKIKALEPEDFRQ